MDPVTNAFPASLTIDYPSRPLDRLSTFFRPVALVPITIILGLITRPVIRFNPPSGACIAGGSLFLATAFMLMTRRKYPRWWFDWNLELTRFGMRVAAYATLLRDEYPSTDDEQAVHVALEYPTAARDLDPWMPFIKWFLAIPHYAVLCLLTIGAVMSVALSWVVILFTGLYPRTLFDFVVGVLRWWLRVAAYAFLLTTDRYPPFSLAP